MQVYHGHVSARTLQERYEEYERALRATLANAMASTTTTVTATTTELGFPSFGDVWRAFVPLWSQTGCTGGRVRSHPSDS